MPRVSEQEERSAPARRLRRLRRDELPVGAMRMARYLIGKTVVHDTPAGRLSGRIVETEAYPPGDAAGHAFRGQTPGNQTLFLGRGYAYVFFTYGSCFMLNVSSARPGVGEGVLIRALEPLEGIEEMKKNSPGVLARDLTRGPGRLARALDINKRYDGADLCAPGPLWLGTAAKPVGRIGRSVRIGITREVERRWRFFERGNPWLSGTRLLNLHSRSQRGPNKTRVKALPRRPDV